MYDLIIRDATIVQGGTRLVADIAVEDGKIAYVGQAAAGGAKEEVQAIGRFLMPGAIDADVHLGGDLGEGGETWAKATRAAVARGVTSVIDMPDPAPLATDRQSVAARADAASAESLACFGFWGGATADNLAELSSLYDDGAICGVTTWTDGEHPLSVDWDLLGRVFTETKGLLALHAEDPKVVAKYRKKWQSVPDPVHNDVRPPKAAVEALKKVIALVQETGRQVHLCSLSTAGELNMLDPYRGELPITAAVCPHHLALSVESSQKLGDAIKVNPPVRTELDRRALWAAVKRGRIDCFTSDHFGWTLADKDKPYWDVPPGIPGIETLWPLLLSGVKHGRVGLERVVEMCSAAPARLFGLEGKGAILEGADADLVLFAEGETARLTNKDITTVAGWSPFVGREVGLAPELVLVNGRIVARHGVLEAELAPAPPLRFVRTDG